MSRENALFSAFVQRYQSGLRCYIRSLGIDHPSVDDYAQEAFLIAYREMEKFDQELDFGYWLKGIARNLIRNDLRKGARRHRITNEYLSEFMLDDNELVHDTPLYEHEELEALSFCIGKLPEKSKRLIELKYKQDYSSGTVASELEMTSNAVRIALMRIRHVLKQCIDGKLKNVRT